MSSDTGLIRDLAALLRQVDIKRLAADHKAQGREVSAALVEAVPKLVQCVQTGEELRLQLDRVLRNQYATHRCKECGALWRFMGDSWSLHPGSECGECCNNVKMGKQIEPLSDAFEKVDRALGEALRAAHDNRPSQELQEIRAERDALKAQVRQLQEQRSTGENITLHIPTEKEIHRYEQYCKTGFGFYEGIEPMKSDPDYTEYMRSEERLDEFFEWARECRNLLIRLRAFSVEDVEAARSFLRRAGIRGVEPKEYRGLDIAGKVMFLLWELRKGKPESPPKNMCHCSRDKGLVELVQCRQYGLCVQRGWMPPREEKA